MLVKGKRMLTYHNKRTKVTFCYYWVMKRNVILRSTLIFCCYHVWVELFWGIQVLFVQNVHCVLLSRFIRPMGEKWVHVKWHKCIKLCWITPSYYKKIYIYFISSNIRVTIWPGALFDRITMYIYFINTQNSTDCCPCKCTHHFHNNDSNYVRLGWNTLWL